LSVNNHLQYYDFHLDEWTKEDCCLSRKHSFTAPLNQTFGPKSANVEQIHRCTFENENHFIFQAFSQSKNTPYCDTYAVLTQYEAEKNPQSGIDVTLSISIKWIKSAWGVKTLIEKNVFESTREYFRVWVEQFNKNQTLLPIESKKHKHKTHHHKKRNKINFRKNLQLTKDILSQT